MGQKHIKKKKPSVKIRDKIKHVFMDLSSDDLLKKCLHGRTQNANEALNQVMWNKCPKNIFVERIVLETAESAAVISFNNGFCGLVSVLLKMAVIPGKYCLKNFKSSDDKRKTEVDLKTTDKVKKQRKCIRAIKKGYQDKCNEREGETYIPVGF